MLTIFFRAPWVIERLRAGSAGRYLDGYALRLHKEGYSTGAGSEFLRTAAHLTQWLDWKGVRLRDWDEAALERFWAHLDVCLCSGRANRGTFPFARSGARRFLGHLREVGAVITRPPPRRHRDYKLLVEFGDWLKQHRGVTDRTVDKYWPDVHAYLRTIGGSAVRITAGSLRNFVTGYSARVGRRRGYAVATALRTFVRFLISSGKADPSLVAAIPAIRKWRLASLPQYLSDADVDRVIAACDPETVAGARDRAVLLLMARLGLRASDVAGLRLQSIDFESATITVSGKSRREDKLPLTQEVGDAIIRYLTHARPKVQSEWLFLRRHAPIDGISPTAVSVIARAAEKRAGVRRGRLGSHVLRYSAATRMLRSGVSLEGIAAVLRHKSTSTTAHYAKVDVDLLRTVAQRWPEVRR
jgi:site-specific recombinase XerD